MNNNIKINHGQTNDNWPVKIRKIHKPELIKQDILVGESDFLYGIQNNEPFAIIFYLYKDSYFHNQLFIDKLVIKSGEIGYFNIPIIFSAINKTNNTSSLFYNIEKYEGQTGFILHERYLGNNLFNIDLLCGYVTKEIQETLKTSNFYCYKNKKYALYFNGQLHDWLWSACITYPQYFNETFDINNLNGQYQNLSTDEYVEEFIKLNKDTWIQLFFEEMFQNISNVAC